MNKKPYYLLAGVTVFALMTWTLWELSEPFIKREPVIAADTQLSNWLHWHASPSLTRAMWAATSFGSTVTVTCISVGFGLYLLRRRQFYWLTAVALSVGGGTLLNRFLKYVFHRPRPHFDDPILTLTSYSFPSGHTMAATVLYGVMAAYFLTKTQDRRWRALIILSAGSLIALVGFSRIYLGAHYLTDVLGALAEGLAWLSLCLIALYSIWRRRAARRLTA